MMIIKAVMFSLRFVSVISLIGGEKRGINSAVTVTVDYAEMSIIYRTTQKN